MIKSKLPIQRGILDSDTPAQLDIENGIIYLNEPYFNPLPQAYQNFIVAHEEGHYMNQSYDEVAADTYAFKKLAGKKPGSLMSMINTIADVLDIERNPEHRERFAEMYRNAMRFNYSRTGDQKYIDEIENFNSKLYAMNKKTANFYGEDQYLYNTTASGYGTAETKQTDYQQTDVSDRNDPGRDVGYVTQEDLSTDDDVSTTTGTDTDTDTDTVAENIETAKSWIITRGLMTAVIVIIVFGIAWYLAKKNA